VTEFIGACPAWSYSLDVEYGMEGICIPKLIAQAEGWHGANRFEVLDANIDSELRLGSLGGEGKLISDVILSLIHQLSTM
jgi:hypothetical protein